MLMEDRYFIPAFGLTVDQLSDRQRQAIQNSLDKVHRRCKNLSEDGEKVLFGTASYLKPLFGDYVKSYNNLGLRSNYNIEESKRRAIATRGQTVVAKSKPSESYDLGGEWFGLTNCFGRYHNVAIVIPVGQQNISKGLMTVDDAGRSMKDVPIEFHYLYQDEKYGGKPTFQVKWRGGYNAIYRRDNIAVGTAFWFGNTASVNSSLVADTVTLNPKYQCSYIEMARFNPIPELRRWDSLPDRCYGLLVWLDEGRYEAETLTNVKRYYPELLSSLNPSEGYFHTIFSDEVTERLNGAPLSSLSDQSLSMMLDSIDICVSRSGRRGQFMRALMGNSIKVPKDIAIIKAYNERAESSNERELGQIVEEAVATRDTEEAIEPLKKMVDDYARTVVFNPSYTKASELFSLTERLFALEKSVMLARRNGLTEIPLLPLEGLANKKIRPDDERFKRGTDADIEELEKPIVIN